MPPGVQDRVVKITGEDVEQLMRAVALILTKLAQVGYSRKRYYPHLATWANLGPANKDMPRELLVKDS
jgi:hypothetical protein